MRVALFSSTIDVTNGYGNITYEYCRALTEEGISWTLFLPHSEKKFAGALPPGWTVVYALPGYIFRFKPHTLLQYLRVVNVADFDLVHSILDFPYCFMAARSAKKYGKPFLMGTQGTYGVLPLTFWPEKYFLKYSYRQAKTIIVPSRFTKEKILKHSGETYPIEIIHNGVRFSRFEKARILPQLKKYDGKKILLTVGGLKARRGQDIVIQALSALRPKYPEVMYVVVGEGEWKSYLQDLARKLNVAGQVDFVGAQSGEDLVAYFQRADIYVQTPKVVNQFNFEGFGIVFLEAGACRKPIVAADSGGVRDAVVDGVTGLIVPEGDAAATAQAIDRLLGNPVECERLGSAGFSYAKGHDWPVIADQFIREYKKFV